MAAAVDLVAEDGGGGEGEEGEGEREEARTESHGRRALSGFVVVRRDAKGGGLLPWFTGKSFAWLGGAQLLGKAGTTGERPKTDKNVCPTGEGPKTDNNQLYAFTR